MKRKRVKKHRLKRVVTSPRKKISKFKQATQERIAKESKYYANGGKNESIESTEKLVLVVSLIIVVLGTAAMLLMNLI
ncbi:hypothetical protein N6G96_07140 [Pediococcus inopinatus]|uniref:Uncharacterized protein n=1 Tax=Pediococcus inopinatus TaxID=114090 RepID=A0ABZ0Q3T9_9LACO|nr:hypothetical protein [Pediococcus inopinatus]WPC19274.1 hypothetical protein N6G95_08565 [Pediococcus inopinatus]WPC21064.1 hypothetical protein N6G96_07140 [Pediococcus inopinatus]